MKNLKRKIAGLLAAVMTLASGGFTAFAAEGDLVTEYGTVPAAYADKNFAAFSEGKFMGAYNELYSATNETSGSIKGNGIFDAVKNAMMNNPVNADGSPAANSKEFQILMLKDATESATDVGYANLAQLRGRVVIDLGGKTLTQYGKKPVFPASAKPWSMVTPQIFETNVTVKNGEILMNKGWFLRYSHYGDLEGTKHMVFNFEDLKFSYIDGYTGGWSLTGCDTPNANHNTTSALYDINFTNCEFDLSTFTQSYEILRAAHKDYNDKIRVNFTITGGNITETDMKNTKIFKLYDSNASVTFMPDPETGLYTTITLPEGAAAPAAVEGGNITLNYSVYETTEDGKVVYAPGIITKYGAIPAAEAKKNFAAFSGGKFLGAYNEFYSKTSTTEGSIKGTGIFDAVKNYVATAKTEAQILMLRDADVSAEKVGYGNVAQLMQHIVIDLNGYTLTQVSDDIIFNAAAKAWGNYGVFDTGLTMKNGNLVLNNGYLMGYASWDGTNDKVDSRPDSVKNMEFNFENIGFSFKDGFSKKLLVHYTGMNHQDPMAAKFDINYTNCSFDMSNLTSNVALMSTDHPATQNTMPLNLDVNYKVTGSNIIRKTADNLVIESLTNGGSVEYLQGTDGEYITLTLPEGVVRPDVTVNVGGTDMIYDKAAANDGYVTYKLITADTAMVKTAYGDILPGHAQDNFAAFSNGKLLFTHDDIFGLNNTGAFHLAKEYVKTNAVNADGTIEEGAKEVQILQLHDADMTSTYANISQYKGNIIIDLGGKTLTAAKNVSVFGASAKPWGTSVFDTNITMKNGKVVLNEGYLISYNTWIGSYTGDLKKHMTFDFEDVEVSLAEGHSRPAVITYSDNGKEPIDTSFDFSFKNCDFDMRNATTRISVFKATHPEEGTKVNYKVSGGNVTALDASLVNVCNFTDCDVNMELLKDSETGDYITLTLPEKSVKSDELLDVNGETMRYEEATEDGSGNVIYKLATPTEFEILDYNLDNKTSRVVIEKDGKYAVVFVSYNGDHLTNVSVEEKEFTKGIHKVEQKGDFLADEVMLWNGLDNMTPVCDSFKVIAATVIGNSFAMDSFTYLSDIMKADGIEMTARNMYIGGRALIQHYNAISDETIVYDVHKDGATVSEYKSINDVLDMYDWDYVMLQGTTHNGQYDEAFWGKKYLTGEAVDAQPYWAGIKDAVSERVPGAKRLVHATWATYEKAAAIFNGKEFANGVPDARGAFTAGIVERAQLGADIYSTEKRADGKGEYIPTAVAVDYLIRHYGFPEYEGELSADNKYSNAPDSRGVYRDQTCHLTDNVGRVLAGLVWYEMMTGTPATENNYKRATLSDSDMAMLKEAAHYACENYMTYAPENVDAYQDAA